ncbi:MAG: sugar phosphate isomerase/epimerase [Chloroflexi bacterium]|nr:sugar phosphate isomerase/epimerase [Chloroflexota bacterium]
MRLGGFLPGIPPAPDFGFADWWEGLDFQLDWAGRLGWRCFVPTDFGRWDLTQQRQAVERMRSRDLMLPGLGAYSCNLIHPDPATRAEHVRRACRTVERAAALGVDSVQVVPGTYAPETVYMYHPGVKSEETWATFTASCREICAACQGTVVRLALEPYFLSMLDTAASLRRALDQVDRPELAINFDLVNMVGLERYWEVNALVDEVVEAVGPAIVLAHLKDLRYQPQSQLRIDEVPPGQGQVDYVHFLRRLHGLGRDISAFIEHLPDLTQMISAWEHVRRAAREAGVT